MNYEYGEPYLEITFTSGNKARIKKSTITDIYEYIDNGQYYVKVHFIRGNETNKTEHWYCFNGTMEEFDNHCKTIYI